MVNLVVRNLLTNAIKFSPKGGTVSMSAKNNGNMVEVHITDAGVGISEEDQQKIFNPSIVLSDTGTAMEKGAGLGLLLCKEFIEENEGQIWVKSEEGKGSTFSFSLKIAN
jgi:two-component system, sensor histidine kinase and response regulator